MNARALKPPERPVGRLGAVWRVLVWLALCLAQGQLSGRWTIGVDCRRGDAREFGQFPSIIVGPPQSGQRGSKDTGSSYSAPNLDQQARQ